MRDTFVGALSCALLLVCGVAFGEPGDGIRAGEFVITPSILAEAGYQSNVHLLAHPNRVDHPDDWLLRLVPQVTLERTGGRAKIQAHALYDWRKYAYNPELDAHDNFEVGAATVVNEGRVLSLTLEDRFRIHSRPAELELLGNYRRISNAARASTLYRPGGALEVKPSVFWNYDRFTADTREFAERHTEGVQVDTRWAFLSRTVIAVTGEGGTVQYTESLSLPGVASRDVNSGSTWWRIDAGVVGQVRPKASIALKAGYGQARYRRNESLTDLRGITATAKAEWAPRVTMMVAGGYERTFQDVFFTNFNVVDRFFLNYRHILAGEWLVQSAAIAEWQEYSEPFPRRDLVFRFEPSVRRVIRKWADAGVAYGVERRWSNEGFYLAGASPDAPSDYVTHRFMATANARF